MNDVVVNNELERTAAVGRVLRAKSKWSNTASRFLGSNVTAEEVAAALGELDSARAELRRLDGAE